MTTIFRVYTGYQVAHPIRRQHILLVQSLVGDTNNVNAITAFTYMSKLSLFLFILNNNNYFTTIQRQYFTHHDSLLPVFNVQIMSTLRFRNRRYSPDLNIVSYPGLCHVVYVHRHSEMWLPSPASF